MASPMHIVLTVNAAWNILNFRQPLVEALLADGHRLTVLASRDEAVPALERLGCSFVNLKMDRKGLNPVSDFALAVRLYRHFRQLRPDCVLSFTIKNNIFGAYAARLSNTRFIPNVTGLGTAFLSSGLLKYLSQAMYKTAFYHLPVVFFQNDDDRDLFVSSKLVRTEQTRTLPGSGIDLEKYAQVPYPAVHTPTRFLMIARLLYDKGVVEFVEAAKLMHGNGAVRFELLGAIDPHNRTGIAKELLDAWIANGTVIHHGTTDDVRPYIAAAHCVVLPSYREGAPRTLIEAAAIGRPLIATNVPGCKSVVDDCVNGFLCDVKSAASLRDAMLRFTALSYDEKAAMAESSRRLAESRFSVAQIISSYQDAIHSTIDP